MCIYVPSMGGIQCRGQSVDTLEAYQRMACADGPSERCSPIFAKFSRYL